MDEISHKMFEGIVLQAAVEVEKGYMLLSQFNNIVLAIKEDLKSNSGFSFLILEKSGERIVFKGNADEFQSANTIFCLRAALSLNSLKEACIN